MPVLFSGRWCGAVKEAIVVPDSVFPKKDPEHPCPCQDRPIKLTYKTSMLNWLKNVGEFVKKDEVVCEGEVEKKTFEIVAPCDGYLLEKCIQDQEEFACGAVLGYIGDQKF
jgi:biotin carboxyl carrier protein